jgi:hypothetical protein
MNNNLTIVSGFWKVVNKHDNKFDNWFSKTLKINCPYVFFGNEESINIVRKHRKSLPTHYINCEISDFYTYKYIDCIETHDKHCPSKELNLIWNEKIFLVKKASELNIFNTEFFSWIDSGICIFRDENPPQNPFPNVNKLMSLPKDKFIFTSSTDFYNKMFVNDNMYYHYVSAGVFIMHKDFINNFVDLYQQFVDELLPKKKWIYTEQVILTRILCLYPQLFCKIADGYGNIIPLLY